MSFVIHEGMVRRNNYKKEYYDSIYLHVITKKDIMILFLYTFWNVCA